MILIVDDKPENIFALKSILEMNNFAVDTAASGEEALRKILKRTYALVILDVQMPEMDGFEVAEAILNYSKTKDTPVIFLSAINKEKKFITKGYKAGAIDYITKPVDPDILLLKVASLYAMSEQRSELRKMQDVLMKEIEARKISQAELAAKNEEMHSVMESMPQIAFTMNREGDVEYTNKKWLDYFGFSKLFPDRDGENIVPYNNWKAAFAAGSEFNGEVKIKEAATGRYKYFLLKIIPVPQDGMIVKWVGTFTDIDQQKHMNELLEQKIAERTSELMNKNKELEISNNELQQVTWVLSHDLKEPVRKILTYGNMIRDRFIDAESQALPHLNRIIDSSERMANLIDDLLDFSRMPGSIVFEQVDLNKVIAEVLADLEVETGRLNASVTMDELPVIDASPHQMRQLFQNLISNALKFSRPGVEPLIRITSERVKHRDVASEAARDGRYCRITIADNGKGFDEKYLSKIFLVFQRLDHHIDGTGIGLAIVKKIVEKHKGVITAQSRINEGSAFIIVLPTRNK